MSVTIHQVRAALELLGITPGVGEVHIYRDHVTVLERPKREARGDVTRVERTIEVLG